MAFPQTNQMMRTMSSDMRHKLGGYYSTLEARYGDPYVKLAKENDLRRAQAAAMHEKAQKTSSLLEDAYKRQVERNRADHDTRLKTNRARKSSSRPAKRVEALSPHRTPEQPAASASADPRDPASQK